MKKIMVFCTLLICLLFLTSAWSQTKEAKDPDALNLQVKQLLEAGRFQEALPLAQHALQIAEKTHGTNHFATSTALNNLASAYRLLGNLDKALPHAQRALKVRESVLGPEHLHTALTLHNLSLIYVSMGSFDKALPLAQKALKIYEKSRTEAGPTYHILRNLAWIYQNLREYEKARDLYQMALFIAERAFGPHHLKTEAVKGDLLAVQLVLSMLDKKKSKNREIDDLVEIDKKIIQLYDAGRYQEALPLCHQSLQMKEKALGADHPLVAASLINAALIYKSMGYYSEAKVNYEKALQILKRSPEPEAHATAMAMDNMANLYQEIGNFDLALPLYRSALEYFESKLGPDHLDTATALNNLAQLYRAMGAPEKAIPLFRRALTITAKVRGPEDRSTRTICNNLGFLYLTRKEYVKAESLFKKGKSKTGLVEIRLATQRPAEALTLLQGLTPSWKDTLIYQAEYHTQLGLALSGLGRQGEATEALLQAVVVIETLRQRIKAGERGGFFQAAGARGHLRAYRGLVATLAALYQKGATIPKALQPYGPDAPAAGFYFAEATKGRVLLEEMAAAARRHGLGEIPPELAKKEQDLVDRLGALEANWEKHHTQGEKVLADYRKQREELQQQLDEVVAELRQKYPRYAALKYPRPLKPPELPMKANEVLLEYALGEKSCYLFRVEPGGRTQVYAIPLGQEELGKLVNEFIAPLQSQHTCQDFSPAQGRKLYELLLAPALKDLSPEKRLIIVPDGILGLLPFEALVVQAGKDAADTRFVGDERLITYSQSAAILALNRLLAASQAKKPLFALGNPIYSDQDPRYLAHKAGKPAPVLSAQAAPQAAFRALATRREWGKTSGDDKEGKELSYLPLPATETEVLAIAKLFGVKPEPPDILLNQAANETRLRQAPLPKYRYLHFATHGDLPGKVQGINEPFILLGQVENQDQDNGFLTLSKVLGLKLDADLVVLSACLTGRGKVMEGEGVAHMARAFQQAGARSVVVSLWEVADAPAVEYMVAFYTHLKAGKPRSEALRLARQQLKSKYPNPYYWAPFILHGEG
ncbi:MAG: tetratricopeptide repeat protein [Deltaproteobacteria bacterium]|nr:tetratricopeptide repeat protein [Deltaproteobacteria bacterium]